MAGANTPYPLLNGAIDAAAAFYHVPVDILTGQWRIESGSTYPNQAVNSAGYGGLFGLSQAQASANGINIGSITTVLKEAMVAASDLANNIASHGGNIGASLLSYSGGGYDSVPGQTTFGNWQTNGGNPYVLPGPGIAGVSEPAIATSSGPDGTSNKQVSQAQTVYAASQGASTPNLPPIVIQTPFGPVDIPNPLGGLAKIFWLLAGMVIIIVGLWLMVEGSRE